MNIAVHKVLMITRLPVTRWVKLSLNFELLNFSNQYYYSYLNKYKSIFSWMIKLLLKSITVPKIKFIKLL